YRLWVCAGRARPVFSRRPCPARVLGLFRRLLHCAHQRAPAAPAGRTASWWSPRRLESPFLHRHLRRLRRLLLPATLRASWPRRHLLLVVVSDTRRSRLRPLASSRFAFAPAAVDCRPHALS